MPEAAALGLRLIEIIFFATQKDRRGTILQMVFLCSKELITRHGEEKEISISLRNKLSLQSTNK